MMHLRSSKKVIGFIFMVQGCYKKSYNAEPVYGAYITHPCPCSGEVFNRVMGHVF